MKNKEKYREQIEDIVFAGSAIAVAKTTREPVMCDCDICCGDCLFGDSDDSECYAARLAWLNKDPDAFDWKSVPIDTLVEVFEPGDTEWRKRYFAGYVDVAGYADGKPAYFQNGATSKTTESSPVPLAEGGVMRI